MSVNRDLELMLSAVQVVRRVCGWRRTGNGDCEVEVEWDGGGLTWESLTSWYVETGGSMEDTIFEYDDRGFVGAALSAFLASTPRQSGQGEVRETERLRTSNLTSALRCLAERGVARATNWSPLCVKRYHHMGSDNDVRLEVRGFWIGTTRMGFSVHATADTPPETLVGIIKTAGGHRGFTGRRCDNRIAVSRQTPDEYCQPPCIEIVPGVSTVAVPVFGVLINSPPPRSHRAEEDKGDANCRFVISHLHRGYIKVKTKLGVPVRAGKPLLVSCVRGGKGWGRPSDNHLSGHKKRQ